MLCFQLEHSDQRSQYAERKHKGKNEHFLGLYPQKNNGSLNTPPTPPRLGFELGNDIK